MVVIAGAHAPASQWSVARCPCAVVRCRCALSDNAVSVLASVTERNRTAGFVRRRSAGLVAGLRIAAWNPPRRPSAATRQPSPAHGCCLRHSQWSLAAGLGFHGFTTFVRSVVQRTGWSQAQVPRAVTLGNLFGELVVTRPRSLPLRHGLGPAAVIGDTFAAMGAHGCSHGQGALAAVPQRVRERLRPGDGGVRWPPRRPSRLGRCVQIQGFSLHPAACRGADGRRCLGNAGARSLTQRSLMRRCSAMEQGSRRSGVKAPWRDGTMDLMMSPLDFTLRLTAPVKGTPSRSRVARATKRCATTHLGSGMPGWGRARSATPSTRAPKPAIDGRRRTSSGRAA